ncbi:MAG TPA: virulence factor BrkB family protein, partial [Bacteroidetes bacterium]|nr:virulence factor BrkB family protein [Bacteroidota bacterium]HEX05536.1 virulence factor BrkB family protein [Bacteroidota bacterium]
MIPIRAANLTFASLLTLIPILIIVFNLFQIFGGADWYDTTVRPFILDNLAPGTGN